MTRTERLHMNNKKELMEDIENLCLKDCVGYCKCISCVEGSHDVDAQSYNCRCRLQYCKDELN